LDGVWINEVGDAKMFKEIVAQVKTTPPNLGPEETEGMVKAAEIIEVGSVLCAPELHSLGQAFPLALLCFLG
jgi:hypothetical protein